jgi:hypothetical protein
MNTFESEKIWIWEGTVENHNQSQKWTIDSDID